MRVLEDIFRVSFLEMKARNSRTQLNWLWNFFPQVFFVICATLIFGNITGTVGIEDLQQLSVGLIVWIYYSDLYSSINSCLVDNRTALLSQKYPEYWFPMRVLARVLVTVAPMLIVFNLFSIVFVETVSLHNIILFSFAFIVGIFLLVSVPLVFMYPTLIFRDLVPLNAIVLQLTFFVTPIGWVKINSKIINIVNSYNPLAMLISALRSVLHGNIEGFLEHGGRFFVFSMMLFLFGRFLSRLFRERVGISL